FAQPCSPSSSAQHAAGPCSVLPHCQQRQKSFRSVPSPLSRLKKRSRLWAFKLWRTFKSETTRGKRGMRDYSPLMWPRCLNTSTRRRLVAAHKPRSTLLFLRWAQVCLASLAMESAPPYSMFNEALFQRLLVISSLEDLSNICAMRRAYPESYIYFNLTLVLPISRLRTPIPVLLFSPPFLIAAGLPSSYKRRAHLQGPSASLILAHHSHPMDSFTATTSKVEDIIPTVNEDGGTGSSGSCVVCKEDTTLPPMNEDGGTGSSGSCIIA
ncbi:hypothetical protein C8R46DRAFT_1307461, partial [Mycena filopes]